MKFGEAIKKRREQMGLTQQDLAEKLFVSHQTVCRYYTPPREPIVDLSCIKVMLTGIFLLVLGAFLIIADAGNMGFAGVCFIVGIIVFLVGLFIPQDRSEPIIDDTLPQHKCPQCGKDHDFDFPECPHCGHLYMK